MGIRLDFADAPDTNPRYRVGTFIRCNRTHGVGDGYFTFASCTPNAPAPRCDNVPCSSISECCQDGADELEYVAEPTCAEPGQAMTTCSREMMKGSSPEAMKLASSARVRA